MAIDAIGVEEDPWIHICRRLSVHRKRTGGKQENTRSTQIAKPAAIQHQRPRTSRLKPQYNSIYSALKCRNVNGASHSLIGRVPFR